MSVIRWLLTIKRVLSAQSSAVVIQTLADTIPPSVPTNVSGTVSGQTVTLTWSGSTDNVGVANYVITRDGAQAASTGSLTYTFASEPIGLHSYSAQAVDAAGNKSGPSAVSSLTVSLISDLAVNGHVDVFDLSYLLSKWGTNDVKADLDHKGTVDIFDLSRLLSH
jgi:hypothetical protein